MSANDPSHREHRDGDGCEPTLARWSTRRLGEWLCDGGFAALDDDPGSADPDAIAGLGAVLGDRLFVDERAALGAEVAHVDVVAIARELDVDVGDP